MVAANDCGGAAFFVFTPMPWVRAGHQETLSWRLRRLLRRLDRRLGGDPGRRIALAFSFSLLVTAFVLVLH